VYLLSLPFGLFRDLGLASSLMVMLIFYIAAGIEIISDEIENPFAGDPNDLPVDQLTRDIIKNIEID
jgi:putative membrane protein